MAGKQNSEPNSAETGSSEPQEHSQSLGDHPANPSSQAEGSAMVGPSNDHGSPTDWPGEGAVDEMVRRAGGRVKQRTAGMVGRGYAESLDAIQHLEDEMSLRPWRTLAAGLLVGGIAGYLIAYAQPRKSRWL